MEITEVPIMTAEITMVLIIMGVAVFLFVTERLRVDLVALLVLVTLVMTGLVTPEQAISGFSNPAVITVWAVFILGGGLARTGVAQTVGQGVSRIAGKSEVQLMVVLMVTAGLLSAFMNNVGVAALFLPVVMDICRRTGISPSRLLMPLAFSTLLGGLITLIGTPPNLLVSAALRDAGMASFKLFDFTPVGLTVMLTGTLFMALAGRHLLPRRVSRDTPAHQESTDLQKLYRLHERMFIVRLPHHSYLAGKTLAQSRLGAALGWNVIAIMRRGDTLPAPGAHTILQRGDRLLVEGAPHRMVEFTGQENLLEDGQIGLEFLSSPQWEFADLQLAPQSPLVGQTLVETQFRTRFGVTVLAIWRDGSPAWAHFRHLKLRATDTLLIQGPPEKIQALRDDPLFVVTPPEEAEIHRLHETLTVVHIPDQSSMVGKTLRESRLEEVLGLTVLGIVRGGNTHRMPSPEDTIMAGDTLVMEGEPDEIAAFNGFKDLEIENEGDPEQARLESEQTGLMEAVLSPHTTLAGKTLRDIYFREKYGLTVLAIWREGQAHRTNLGNMPLRFGDALLLYGPRQMLKVMGSEQDFLVLAQAAQEAPRKKKAPLALAIMACVVGSVLLGWLPIYLAAIAGCVAMILAGCLTMDEAYRYVDWRAVFLIAGMLPLGIALQESGAARFLAEAFVRAVGPHGPYAVVAGLFLFTALAAQTMPTSAVAVLLAPIAIDAARDLGMSPHALLMAVAMSASASFMSPVAHPSNILVMGPGGYRFLDYIKVGAPLTLATLAAVLLILPVFWPLFP